jgi:assimilatory nitrate reductase catalytic subunit
MADSGSSVRTTCPYCGVGCGVLASPRSDGKADIAGDPAHPANFGRLCSKGSALGETVSLDRRLLYPTLRGGEGDRRIAWDTALDLVASEFRRIIDEHGPEAVALYISGQLLTEDYYVANKFVKGWLGTANVDTNSRLCMSSAVAGHKRAFGEDLVPCSYEDLEQADLLVLVGSNTAWCHPVVFQRIVAAREARPQMKVVVIDPRRTATCDIADLHLPLHSGSDVPLFNGLLAYLQREGRLDTRFVEHRTEGVNEALAVAREEGGDLAAVARACGLSAAQLAEFYALYARTERVVTLFSMGVNQSSAGTDKVNAIINCHLYSGRIGRPGMGPFSITGQPNAMGGREVGGLANTLAAHMDLDNPAHRERVQRFWKSPLIASRPGLKAVDLFSAMAQGKLRAVWIMCTNPVVSLPDADAVREALRQCELVVVSEVLPDTDTARHAHILLPAAGWGEKDGTVTNSERRISRQRAFLPLPGEARPDWWQICEVAKRMGYAEGFSFAGAHDVFTEYARMTAFENDGERALNLAGLAQLSRTQYDALQPLRWPVPASGPTSADGALPYFSAAPSALRRLRFVATPARAPAHAPDEEFPLILNTGRIRDQWHTMTRTARAARLNLHRPEPYVEINAVDMLIYGVRDGELARVSTRWGALVARVRESLDVQRGNIFVPIHWNDAYAADARVGALVNPVVDPVSGEPEFKHTPARVEVFQVDWYGFVLTRGSLDTEEFAYWARADAEGHARYELAGRGAPPEWALWARAKLGRDGEWLDYCDSTAGVYRAARVVDGRLQACVFLSPRPDLPAREWLGSLFARERLEVRERMALLAGRPALGADPGPTVCSCFGVGRGLIEQAIRGGCLTTQQIGGKLKAGTNCGSCLPEIRRLLMQSKVEAAA